MELVSFGSKFAEHQHVVIWSTNSLSLEGNGAQVTASLDQGKGIDTRVSKKISQEFLLINFI